MIENPVEKVPVEYLEATSGPEFAVAYGWVENVDDLPSNVATLLEKCWDTAKAIGKADGLDQIDSELRHQLAEARDRETAMQSERDSAEALANVATRQLEETKSELRDAAKLVRVQRDQYLQLHYRMTSTLRYRVLDKIRELASRKMQELIGNE
ncbi:hypothetical protein SEA_MACGULLY_25 [Rhodococcus phage MacGully]|nr:hypothetical protein SEA_MACGULLY_25 [Rhodococcus phage MacGully]